MVMAGSMVLVQQCMVMVLTSNKGKNTQAGDPTDTETWGLPRYMGGGNVNVFYQGIQSKDSAYKYLKNTGNYDDAKLESLRTATTSAEATEAAKGISKDDLKLLMQHVQVFLL